MLRDALSAAAAGSSEDCAGGDCVVSTFDSACCSDGFACLAQLPSPKCHANPFPVVPPSLNNPRLIVNSTSVAATASSAGISTARVLPKRGAHDASSIQHTGQVCGTPRHAVSMFYPRHQGGHCLPCRPLQAPGHRGHRGSGVPSAAGIPGRRQRERLGAAAQRSGGRHLSIRKCGAPRCLWLRLLRLQCEWRPLLCWGIRRCSSS